MHVPGLDSLLNQIGDAAENFVPEEINRLINEQNVELPFDPAEQPYKMVIAIREDYFAQLQGLRQVLPGVTVRQNHFPLVRLTGTQALEAITGPAPTGMITYRVAVEIIRFVANASEQPDTESMDTGDSLDHFEVEPAILSLVCQQLDSKRQALGKQSITVDFVKQSKGQILQEFYDFSLELVKMDTRYFIENQLLDSEGFRTSEPESNFTGHLIDPADIQILIEHRIIHRVEQYGRAHLELSHDVLAPIVRHSRDTRLFQEEKNRKEAENALLRKQRRRTMKIAVTFGFLFFVSLIALLFGIQKQKEVQLQSKRNKGLYFNSISRQLSDQNPDLAICYAQLAYVIDSSKYNSNGIHKLYYNNKNPCSRIFFDHRTIMSPDGTKILNMTDTIPKLCQVCDIPFRHESDSHSK